MQKPGQNKWHLLRNIRIFSRRAQKGTVVGDYRSAFKGKGLDFDRLREYMPGDDIRLIDWNASARSTGVMIKQFIQERDQTVLIGLDRSESMKYSSQPLSKEGYASEIASALAYIASQNKDRVGSFLYKDYVYDWSPPARGNSAFNRALGSFSGEAVTRGAQLGTLPQFLSAMKSKRGATIFIVSDFAFLSEHEIGRLSTLSRICNVVGVRVVDPCEAGEFPKGKVSVAGMRGIAGVVDGKMASEVLKRHSEYISSSLQRAGCEYLECVTSTSYIDHLTRFFKARTRRQI